MNSKELIFIIVAFLLSIVACAYLKQPEIAFFLTILGYITIDKL